MNIRIHNAKILTMVDNQEIFDGELWIKDKKIVYCGDAREDFAAENWDRQIDAKGNLLMPGFKDAHTHSGMTFLRSLADDGNLQDWYYKIVFPMEGKLQGDDVYYLTILAIMEYLTSGITANADMYKCMPQIARAAIDTGFRTVLVCGFNDFSDSEQELIDGFEEFNNMGDLVSFQMGIHAEYTTSRENFLKAAKIVQDYKVPMFVHNSENEQEVSDCIKRYGMTPTQVMDSFGLFNYGGGGYHCVCMDDKDLEIFKNRDMTVITNPASNLKLASGIAPVKQMLDMGIRMAIGTDGPASNNCLDMFREMFLVAGLAKVREKNPQAVDANQVLRMATLGGSHTMELKKCDTLEAGQHADLIMIDLQQPNMQPINNITKNLVYSGSKQNVKMTMVNGKILYEDGKFDIGIEASEVYARANEIIGRILRQ